MFRLSFRRTLAVLVVSLALATPWCAAAARPGTLPGRAGHPAASGLPDLVHHVWGWLTGLWAKEGCSIDPGGHCTNGSNPAPDPGAPATSESNADVGCSIDPNGSPCGGRL